MKISLPGKVTEISPLGRIVLYAVGKTVVIGAPTIALTETARIVRTVVVGLDVEDNKVVG